MGSVNDITRLMDERDKPKNEITMYDHAPGPFRVVEDIHNSRPEIRDSDGRRVAAIIADYPMGNKFMDAHAALFAAAPDLLRERDELRKKLDRIESIAKSEKKVCIVSRMPGAAFGFDKIIKECE